MITEADYTEQVKRVVAELVGPLDDIDKIDILIRTIPGVTQKKVVQILDILGYKTSLLGDRGVKE